MSLNNIEQLNQILEELKRGSLLIKQKENGEKYSRHFYFNEQDNFISYHLSEKVFAQSRRCKSYKYLYYTRH